MNRDALDAWFAQADDVLTDWNGGTDAMHSEPSQGEQEPAVADSYYAQTPIIAALQRIQSGVPVAQALATAGRRWQVELQADDGTWRPIGWIEPLPSDRAAPIDPILGNVR